MAIPAGLVSACVISGHFALQWPCPLYHRTQTSDASNRKEGQKRPLAYPSQLTMFPPLDRSPASFVIGVCAAGGRFAAAAVRARKYQARRYGTSQLAAPAH